MSVFVAANVRANRLVLALVVLIFFCLLGTRSLNEPDEGRYGEIAREMVESGDWLVPRIWYVPHLDKPPMTYWLVALSIKVFGVNEWAIRLPLALAGLSGVLAAFLLARRVAGDRAARWSALILSTSLLYFAMARMLTTDIFLGQFIAWAGYFFWRSWQTLDGWNSIAARPSLLKQFLGWQLAMWTSLAGGFLTKGPVALAIPFAAIVALTIFRRQECHRWKLQLLGAAVGVPLFCLLALPWFLLVFQNVPQAFDFMVRDRFAGHALGTTVKNRGGPLLYFVPILAFGFLPWTPLLGWLWRRGHWRSLGERQKDGWLFLTVWTAFTFLLFSLNRSKLPAYIVPLFPPLAVLVAWRWFSAAETPGKNLPRSPRGARHCSRRSFCWPPLRSLIDSCSRSPINRGSGCKSPWLAWRSLCCSKSVSRGHRSDTSAGLSVWRWLFFSSPSLACQRSRRSCAAIKRSSPLARGSARSGVPATRLSRGDSCRKVCRWGRIRSSTPRTALISAGFRTTACRMNSPATASGSATACCRIERHSRSCSTARGA